MIGSSISKYNEIRYSDSNCRVPRDKFRVGRSPVLYRGKEIHD